MVWARVLLFPRDKQPLLGTLLAQILHIGPANDAAPTHSAPIPFAWAKAVNAGAVRTNASDDARACGWAVTDVEDVPLCNIAHAIRVRTMGAIEGLGPVKLGQRRRHQEGGRGNNATEAGDREPSGICDGHEFSPMRYEVDNSGLITVTNVALASSVEQTSATIQMSAA